MTERPALLLLLSHNLIGSFPNCQASTSHSPQVMKKPVRARMRPMTDQVLRPSAGSGESLFPDLPGHLPRHSSEGGKGYAVPSPWRAEGPPDLLPHSGAPLRISTGCSPGEAARSMPFVKEETEAWPSRLHLVSLPKNSNLNPSEPGTTLTTSLSIQAAHTHG